MAATINNIQSANTGVNTASTVTIASYTPSSGPNQTLVVFVGVAAVSSLSGVTFNGNAMSFHGAQDIALQGRVEEWRMTAPGVSAGNIVATLASGSQRMVMMAATILGNDQTTPIASAQGASSASGTNATCDFSNGTDGETILAFFIKRNSTEVVFTGGSNTTVLGQVQTSNGTASANVVGVLVSEPKSGTTTVNATWLSANRPWAMVGGALKDASANAFLDDQLFTGSFHDLTGGMIG